MSTTRRALLKGGQGEEGFTILEAVVALALFALVITGVAASSSAGLRLVTKSNGRQTATQLAVKEMELLRGTPYSGIGLPGPLTKNPDINHPDNDVSPSGTDYAVPEFGPEPLTIFTAGSTDHGPDTATENNFTFQIYRYVTWVDDPLDAVTTEDFKRVTVVLQWGADAGSPTPNTFALSSLFSAGSVGWLSPATTTPTTTPPTTTPPTTAPPSPTPACAASDVTPPTGTIAIVAGTGALTGYTSQGSVLLQLTASDDAGCTATADLTMLLSNDGASFSPFPFDPSPTWPLASSADGDHTVYVKYRDQALNESGSASALIRVDATKPTQPAGTFTVVRSTSPAKSATLSWGNSTDNDVLVGYRIYKKIGTGSFAILAAPSAPCSPSPCRYLENGTLNPGTSYTYYVVAYDAAGNESIATASITV